MHTDKQTNKQIVNYSKTLHNIFFHYRIITVVPLPPPLPFPPFFVVPKIVIEDQSDFTVVLSPFSSSGGFIIAVYALFEVASYSFTKDDGQTVEVFISLIFQSEWETVSRYQIGFPALDKASDGNYTFSLTDEGQNMKKQTISITKAQSIVTVFLVSFLMFIPVFIDIIELRVLAHPGRLEVLEGFSAEFECFAEVNVHVELEWSRDYEPLLQNKVIYHASCV